MSAEFVPSGIITLTTDLGTRGAYVGVLHGVMLAAHPDARIVDLTHDVEVHWPAEAGFWIERAYDRFPLGTIHVAVVESSSGLDRVGLVVVVDGHAFVGPDNGLFASLADRPDALAFAVSPKTLLALGVRQVSPTFRGRDAQSPIAGALASRRLRPDEVGPRVTDWVPSLVETPARRGPSVHGVVVTVDGFGNILTNIDAALVGENVPTLVTIAGRSLPLRRSYAESAPGALLALINAFGVLEVARAHGSAADTLGVGRGAPVVVIRQNERS